MLEVPNPAVQFVQWAPVVTPAGVKPVQTQTSVPGGADLLACSFIWCSSVPLNKRPEEIAVPLGRVIGRDAEKETRLVLRVMSAKRAKYDPKRPALFAVVVQMPSSAPTPPA